MKMPKFWNACQYTKYYQFNEIRHKDSEDDLTYKSIILEELESELRIIENAIESLTTDFAEVQLKLTR